MHSWQNPPCEAVFEPTAAATPFCEGGVKADGEMSEHRYTN